MVFRLDDHGYKRVGRLRRSRDRDSIPCLGNFSFHLFLRLSTLFVDLQDRYTTPSYGAGYYMQIETIRTVFSLLPVIFTSRRGLDIVTMGHEEVDALIRWAFVKKFNIVMICEAIQSQNQVSILSVHHRSGSHMFYIPSATTIMLDPTRRQSHPDVHHVHLSNCVPALGTI